jgi:hypothetical protein
MVPVIFASWNVYLCQNEDDGVVAVSATGMDRHRGGLVNHHDFIVLVHPIKKLAIN